MTSRELNDLKQNPRMGIRVIDDDQRIRAYVRVGIVYREHTFEADATTVSQIVAWRAAQKAELKRAQPKAERGAFDADLEKYLDSPRRQMQAGFPAKRSELRAWLKELASTPRVRVTPKMAEEIRDRWIAAKVSPKTINHRVRTARQMWRDLDGENCPTPFDDLFKDRLTVETVIPTFIEPKMLRDVMRDLPTPKPARLVRRKRDGAMVPAGNRAPDLDLAALDQARCAVLATTGVRPAQLKRAEIKDINLDNRLWLVRPAKGGNPIPIVLNDDMRDALKRLLELGGVGSELITPKRGKPRRRGDFDSSSYAKRLRRAGFPEDVKPYNMKHTVGMTLADAGIDMELIADTFGHQDTRTARIYTGIRTKRLKVASDALQKRGLNIGKILRETAKSRMKLLKKKAS